MNKNFGYVAAIVAFLLLLILSASETDFNNPLYAIGAIVFVVSSIIAVNSH